VVVATLLDHITEDSMSPEQVAWHFKKPFKPQEIHQRKGPGGKMLSYINARDVMKRLDDVVGSHNWSDRYVMENERVTCELTVRYGDEWITKSDGAGETQIEGEKGIFSDAFKRAAVKHGIGRHLYYERPITPEQYERLVPCPTE
jgi:hypothetical protein